MKFKLDENIPLEGIEFLQREGYEAISVMEEKISGREDAMIAECVRSEEVSLITLDLDFSDIRLYPPEDYSALSSFVLTDKTRYPLWNYSGSY